MRLKRRGTTRWLLARAGGHQVTQRYFNTAGCFAKVGKDDPKKCLEPLQHVCRLLVNPKQPSSYLGGFHGQAQDLEIQKEVIFIDGLIEEEEDACVFADYVHANT